MSPPCSFSPSSASSSSDIPSQNGQVLAPRPLPTWEEIRAAVPKECFEKSLLRSLYYLAIDLLVIGFLYAIVPFVETKFGLIGLFFWYCLLGMFLSSLFCVGHDCGHGTFSDWTWVNDIFGHISHALLMVPFWPWQKSHRQHHQFTSHVDKDKGHPWVLEDDYEGGGWLRKHFAKIPLSGLIRWNPIYTVAGLPDGSHFWPFSRLFSNNTERFKCAISSSLCLLTSWAIFVLLDHSPWAFLKYYYVPLMFQGYWMVIITYLQHQDEQIEVYEEGNWAFVKGQLQTYDREYGFGIDHAMHHITDDACLNFCLNDGICRKNRLGHVECQCKENFSGERCEIRFQPRSQKLAYWTGSIVSVVFLLIIIVVVIWMISLRFNRSSSSEAKFSYWMVIITYLHQDEQIEVYEEGN